MKKVKIICANCNKEHEIRSSDYKRKIKAGRKNFYCSLKCSGQADFKNNPEKLSKFFDRNAKNLIGKANNKLDQYSPFKYHANKARSRSKARGEITDVTPEYLKHEVWDKQGGICPYTGISMELPRTTQDEDIKKTPIKASLDRIDPSKGYIKGNVEYVCYCINVAKNDFTKSEMIDFIKKIKTNHIV